MIDRIKRWLGRKPQSTPIPSAKVHCPTCLAEGDGPLDHKAGCMDAGTLIPHHRNGRPKRGL